MDARQRLSAIALDDASLDAIAQRCFAAAVDGLRADLVWLRGARAHAAWRGASQIEAQDIDALEPFVLAHRRREHTPPAASQTPAQNQAQQHSQQEQGEGQWGALPPQAVAVGERREPPAWPKKP
jgi:magnesium chelatase subunit I